MLLSEPPRTPYDLNFVLFGVPVRIHPMFWLISLLFSLGGGGADVSRSLLWVTAVFVSVLTHEMGHALAIMYYGWRPRITLYGMGGLASYNPTRRSPQSQIVISLAGPAAGFLLAAFLCTVIIAAKHRVEFHWNDLPYLPITFSEFDNKDLTRFIVYLLEINIFWGMINLLPVIPLDGGQVAREVLDLRSPGDGLRRSLIVSVWVGAAVALYAVARLHETYIALMFGYLAYNSFSALESYFGRGRGFGGRW